MLLKFVKARVILKSRDAPEVEEVEADKFEEKLSSVEGKERLSGMAAD